VFHNRSFIVLVALALLATSAIVLACAPAPTPTPAPTPVPPTEANKALVRRYVEQVPNGGHFEVLDEMAAPSYKRYLSAVAAPLNASDNKIRLAKMRIIFPDLQITLDDMIAEGDRVVYRGTARGTQKVAFMGILPTGKQGTVTVIEIFRIENGKFVEHWGGPDTMDMVEQLGGVVTAAPPK